MGTPQGFLEHSYLGIFAVRRAAAFLTAGIACVPFCKFVVADAGAALLSVPLGFGLAYFFTDQITAIAADVHRVERWLALAGLLGLAAVLVLGVWRWKGQLGTERPEEEPTEGHASHPWTPPQDAQDPASR